MCGADVQFAHLFDIDYFRFLRRLVEAYTHMFHVGNHKLRRTEYTSSPVKSSSGSGTNEDGMRSAHRAGESCSREEEEQQHLANIVLRLALHFLLKVGQPIWCPMAGSTHVAICSTCTVMRALHCCVAFQERASALQLPALLVCFNAGGVHNLPGPFFLVWIID